MCQYFAMAPLKCCVTGCNATSDSHCLFSLPKDDNMRSLWMSFLVPHSSHLIGLTKEQLLRKRVCQQHFDRYQMDGQGRRTRYSYPCLYSAKEIAHGVPLSSEEYHVLTEHNYHRQSEEDENNDDETLLVLGATDAEHSYSSHSLVQLDLVPVITATQLSEFKDAEQSNLSHSVVQLDKVSVVTPTPLECKVSPSTSHSYDGKPLCDVVPVIPKPKRKASITNTLKSKFQRCKREIKTIVKQNSENTTMQKLEQAQYLLGNSALLQNFKCLTKQAQTLILMQLKLVNKNKMARRFTTDEKLLALTLLKQSPKAYRLLEKMFTLPNKRTLNRMSEKITFEPGINPKVFNYIKETVKEWDSKKKLCTIVFDEVALSPRLTFNEAKGTLNGFVEICGERKLKFCDHALVFMIRGICYSWRQNLAYYFCEGTVSAAELVQIIKEIVFEVGNTGLLPVGLVCDQGSTFRTALNKIRQETVRSRNIQGIHDDGTVEIAQNSLNIFYDPPHLLKSIRNNFVTKDMMFNGKMGSWKDIMFIYDVDSQLGHTRAMPKLTAHHVVPNKIKKMKVSVATQVLSARTAAMLKYTSQLNVGGETMGTTADIVEFFDSLFDSVNGSPGRSKRGKMRNSINENSTHLEFWQDSVEKLRNIMFIDRHSKFAIQSGKPRYVRVPCLEGWVTSLESFIRISKLLFNKYRVQHYYPGYINQDPLENFFGRIRSVNYRNVNPDAHTFIYSYKALVLSNVLSPHSRFSNCQEDDGETLISIKYLFETDETNKENICPSLQRPIMNPSSSNSSKNEILKPVLMEKVRVQCSAYTAGYICRNLTKVLNCKNCLTTYTTKDVDSTHSYIQHREYKSLKRNNLAYPNGPFLRLYREAAQVIHNYLNTYGHEKDIGIKLKIFMLKELRFSWLGCSNHKIIIKEKFLTNLIRLQVHNWCKIVNRILCGKIPEKYVEGEVQKMAYNKYVKIRLRRRVLNK